MPKTALVISGGGCKGAFAIGVVEYLLEQQVYFDIYAGTSTGALIAPLLAAEHFDKLKHIYSTVRTKDLLRRYCCLTLPWRASLYKDKGLKRIINNLYTSEIHTTLQQSNKTVLACTVNLNTTQIRYWSPKECSRETFVEALRASANQPGLMPPVLLEGDYYVDGGVREIIPIHETIKRGATKIYAVLLEPVYKQRTNQKYDRIIKTLTRTLDTMFTETYTNDITGGVTGEIKLIQPEKQLVENSLEFDPETMREMMQLGYRRAQTLCGEETWIL